MDAEKWETTLIEAGLEPASAETYASTFAKNKLTLDSLPMLDRPILAEMGVTILGEALAILKLAKPSTKIPHPTTTPAKPPKLSNDMTSQQFRKFLIDWEVFLKMTGLPTDKHNMCLYNSADEDAQNNIINSHPNFFSYDIQTAMKTVEDIVKQKSNPLVHRLTFATITQDSTESISNFVMRLKSSANDCNFSCPKCESDISDTYIKDQFVRGVNNESLQTDLLARAGSLKTLDQNITHAETFEAAVKDQTRMSSGEAAAYRLSAHRKGKQMIPNAQRQPHKKVATTATYSGCGSTQYGTPGSNNRHRLCPAWGKTCNTCGRPNHFASVCRAPANAKHVTDNDANTAEMDLIAHVVFDQMTNTYTTNLNANQQIEEINATVIPFSPEPEPRHKKNIPPCTYNIVKVFPDSGASICLAGPQHLKTMNLSEKHLIPSNKIIRAVGGFTLVCMGWVPLRFTIGDKSTKQALYICDKVQKIYLSKLACIEVGILPQEFPNPCANLLVVSDRETANKSLNPEAPMFTPPPATTNAPREHSLPARPDVLPFQPTEANIGKLKQWLLDNFANSAFRLDDHFPAMTGPPAHIHLKEGATPRARHNPIPIPFHFKEAVKESLWKDVARGIISPVPIGTPTDWCATMVITAKKDGRPRRTIDYQYLNSQCKRETHHTSSPFQLAMQVPPNTKKTVLDAVDGYHSVALDEESQPLTTFITEWGRFMYLRMPQGYLASGDAYTRRYDELIKDVERKVKIVDDALLYDNNIEQAFYHVFDYLHLGAQNGIVFNRSKFQFCQDNVQFAGLQITSTGVEPSQQMLQSILKFPTPNSLTDARSWFGLVNQVAWAYSLGSIMQPFRELVKGNPKSFTWNDSLEKAFQESKQVIVDMVKDGVVSFNPQKTTCVAPDWSKEGMGFVLLQKYCPCDNDKAPVCCPDGWKLIFAGSKFCSDAESRYAPIEGEAAALAWSLEKCSLFITGCPNLIAVTDHEPLKGIFGDRDLSKIKNPRLFKLKEKTLRYRFTIQHCPGRWHRFSDAMSRNPVAFINAFKESDTLLDSEENEKIEQATHIALLQAISEHDDKVSAISLNLIRTAAKADMDYIMLSDQVEKGFPKKRPLLQPSLRDFWEVRRRLSTDDGLVLMDDRIVMPMTLRKQVLRSLHSAHQGVLGMSSRAREYVYWPGIDKAIRNFHACCITCSNHAPSLPREPLLLTPTPEWPFQQIVMDLCYVGHHTYLVCADRFTGWPIIYHLRPGQATAERLVAICRSLFETYGAPDEISSDGGPPFTAYTFREFLKSWGIKQRIASVAYPQSNGRAELAVKAAKRIIYGNTTPQGSLNNDRAARAVLQYRNTPIQGIGLSPAQMLLHRRLKDFIPAQPKLYRPHPEWVKIASRRGEMLNKRNNDMTGKYNATAYNLPPLTEGVKVAIQNPRDKRWTSTGKIIECLPNRQYKVRIDGVGRTTLRNRRFLKPFKPTTYTPPFAVGGSQPTNSDKDYQEFQPSESENPAFATPHQAGSDQSTSAPATPSPIPTKTPRALLRLHPHNQPGGTEQTTSVLGSLPSTRSGRMRGGEGEM